MSWLPTFLSPVSAAMAAAIAVPLLLLLYFLKLRRREMAVPSTLLWKKAVQDLQVNAPFQRLRKNLLLLLQLLILLALLLAMARPVINANRAAGKASVILIDRSASMSTIDADGKSRLDAAKRQARDLVETLGKDASAMVIAFDDSAELVQSFTSDRSRLRWAIDSIKPTDRRSALREAYRLAEAQASSFAPEARRPSGDKADIWLFSDGRVSDQEDLPLRNGLLHYQKIGSAESRNIGIVTLSAKRNYERPTEVQVFARLANFGPEPVEGVEVMLTVDGQVQGVRQKLVLLPERWSEKERAEWSAQHVPSQDSVDFTLELSASALVRVEQLHKEGDLLPADDSAQIVVPPPKTLSVMVVSKGNYFLQRIVERMKLRRADVVTPEQYEQRAADPNKLAADYDLVIYDRWVPESLPPVGNFVYFGCVPPGLKLKQAGEGDAGIVKGNFVLTWNRQHSMLRNLNLGRLYAERMVKLDLPPEDEVLVEADTGPMIVLHRESRTVHLVVAFDLLESNWPLRWTFPAFMDKMVRFMALGGQMEIRQSFAPGATPLVPLASIRQALGNENSFRLVIPGGEAKRVDLPPAGDVALPALERVGLYTTQPPLPGLEKIAVNLLDENESNLLPVDQPPVTTPNGAAVDGGRVQRDLWWYILAFAAIPLCLTEWWVYTRRVHL